MARLKKSYEDFVTNIFGNGYSEEYAKVMYALAYPYI